ncbi:MAG: branched-chain amino acid ABC transporter permease [Xanthobacteraceae bacterium]|nr:MAG: branched-chain amino acid ABC transporter permease [Xanthobacteraceae bacterium]
MSTLFSGQLLFAALVVGSIYVLIALGLNLVFGTMRLLDAAHGDIVMLGAYTSFWLFTLSGMSPLLSMLVAGALSAGFGAAIYYGLFRRLLANTQLSQRLEGNSLLLFFGISIILQNVAALCFDTTPRAYTYLDGIIRFGNVAMTGNRIAVLIIAAVLCAAAFLFLRFHIYGLAIKALIQHRQAAAVVGVNIERIQLLSFAIGFGLAGLAGSLLSMTEQITPFMGFPFTVAGFVTVILGGLGNLTRGMAAGMFLGFVEIYGVALTSPSLHSVLIYGVFIVVLFLQSQGLLGRRPS